MIGHAVIAVVVMFLFLLRKPGVAIGVTAGIALIFLPNYAKIFVFDFFISLALWGLADKLFGAAKPWFVLLEIKESCLEHKLCARLTKIADYACAGSCIGFYLSMGLVLTNVFFAETYSPELTIDNPDSFLIYLSIWTITFFATALFLLLVFIRDMVTPEPNGKSLMYVKGFKENNLSKKKP